MNPRSFGGQIPVPGQDATQSELLFFAITYNGYNRIKGGVPAVANLANPVIDKFKKEKTLPEDLNLLRLTLFWCKDQDTTKSKWMEVHGQDLSQSGMLLWTKSVKCQAAMWKRMISRFH